MLESNEWPVEIRRPAHHHISLYLVGGLHSFDALARWLSKEQGRRANLGWLAPPSDPRFSMDPDARTALSYSRARTQISMECGSKLVLGATVGELR